MLVTKSAIQALMVSFSSLYRAAYSETSEFADELVTTIPSSTKTNTYGWMTRILKMREWIGPRRLQNLNTQSYSLTNRTFENTVAVDVDDIEDDNLGVYNPLMSELGRTSRKWKDQITKETLQAGGVEVTWDGVPFFSAAHDIDPAGVQKNVRTSTPLTADNYNAVRAEMLSYTGEDGEALGVMPNILVVPPQLELAAKDIINNGTRIVEGSNGATAVANSLAGTARIVVIPELANQPGTWYLMDNTKAIRGLVFQLRSAPSLVQQTALSDDCVFEDNEFRMGVKARGAGGYGMWFLAYKCSA